MNPALLSRVHNRGTPPESFVAALIEWGRSADAEIFAPNPSPVDIYSLIAGTLGPWETPLRRRAAMLETMRVHAGFESGWNWKKGVDTTNKTSMAHPEGEETGAWQVSYNSAWLGSNALLPYLRKRGLDTPSKFIPEMKTNHTLAMDYYARLVRVSIAWAGPLKRQEVLPWLSREAMLAFESALE